jgi:hypothetical protein
VAKNFHTNFHKPVFYILSLLSYIAIIVEKEQVSYYKMKRIKGPIKKTNQQSTAITLLDHVQWC